MQGMKAVPGEQTQKVPPCGTAPRHRLQKRTMKTLTKIALALAIVLFATVLASHAGEWVNGYTRTDGTCVSGYYRNTPAPSYSTTPSYNSTPSYPAYSTGGSSGYVFRNPYAATPSVSVRGYTPSSGTYVAPYVRTAPNHTVTDNLTISESYRLPFYRSSSRVP